MKEKNTINIDIMSKVKKINFEELLNNPAIFKNKAELSGSSAGAATETYQYLLSQVNDLTGVLTNEIDELLNESITEDMQLIIEQVMKAKATSDTLENEVRILKNKAATLQGKPGEDRIKFMSILLDIDVKEDEYEKAKKEFISLYRSALDKTILPRSLTAQYRQMIDVNNSYLVAIDDEIENMKAKINALQMFAGCFDLKENTEQKINNKLNMSLVAKSAIESSEQQTPLIRLLIK